MASFAPVKGRIDLSKIYSRYGSADSGTLYIALSVQASEYPDRFFWARDHEFAFEYTPDPLKPELIAEHVTSFIDDGVPVRFHTRFGNFEMGNADTGKAAEALTVHKNVIDAIQYLGERKVTVHLNLSKKIPFDAETAVANLIELTAYAKEKGVTVNLENLKAGPTSNPYNIVKWAEQAGSLITMDMGHAVSSDFVQNGALKVTDYVDGFASRLNEMHMYGKELDRHYPITDMTNYMEPVKRILQTNCRWWTIELDDYKEALGTRDLLLGYLSTV